MQLSALPAHLNSTQELNARGAFFFFSSQAVQRTSITHDLPGFFSKSKWS